MIIALFDENYVMDDTIQDIMDTAIRKGIISDQNEFIDSLEDIEFYDVGKRVFVSAKIERTVFVTY